MNPAQIIVAIPHGTTKWTVRVQVGRVRPVSEANECKRYTADVHAQAYLTNHTFTRLALSAKYGLDLSEGALGPVWMDVSTAVSNNKERIVDTLRVRAAL